MYNCSNVIATMRPADNRVALPDQHTKGTRAMAKRYHTPIQIPLPIEGSTIDIPLTKGQVTTIDSEDADLLQYNWFASAVPHYAVADSYVAVRSVFVSGRWQTQFIHRMILSRVLGRELLKREQVDHIDTNPLNNRRNNLRIATPVQNGMNKHRYSSNTTGFKGVWYRENRGKWVAAITINGKKLHLGYFTNPEEAHEAYKEAARKYFGEYARFE